MLDELVHQCLHMIFVKERPFAQRTQDQPPDLCNISPWFVIKNHIIAKFLQIPHDSSINSIHYSMGFISYPEMSNRFIGVTQLNVKEL